MRVLIYKRTHINDPSPDGVFGVHDCMGSVRSWTFDAVIGIGGIGKEPQTHGIARKINWIGIGPRKQAGKKNGFRGPSVTFDHFLLMEEKGPEVAWIAPRLARHMFDKHRRFVMSDNLPTALREEVSKTLKMAEKEPGSSKKRSIQTGSRACAPKRARKCR